ncbi:MAG TPA: hypothetical protein VG843_07170 [Rhizomicrobium sp.]|nr:hypothetical protein [Rhizomicrobium sp.]
MLQQEGVPRSALRERHHKRRVHGVGDLVRIVGIDEKRSGEIARDPGEARKHQYAGIGRILRRHIFVRHQIHPVSEWGDKAGPRRPVESRKRRAREALAHISQRHPVERAVAAVDVASHPAQRLAQRCELGHLLARRHGDLQIAHLLAMFGKARKQPIEGLEAVGKALRIVEAVHADHQRAPGKAVD